MDTPPPYGALIELTRKAARLSMQRAADRAAVTKQTWIDIVKGRTASPKAEMIASMAGAVGVSPDRLAGEGNRPDAAEILREILRRDAGAPDAGQGDAPEDAALAEFENDERIRPEERLAAVALIREIRRRRSGAA